MRIAFVVSECDPILKVGGLADVAGSLPRALRALGHDVEVYMPRFAAIPAHAQRDAVYGGEVHVRQHPLPHKAEIYHLTSRGVPVHLIACPDLYEREPHPYGQYDDQPARWAFFCLAVLEIMARERFTPDVIHVHDWPTGLLPVYKSLRFGRTSLQRTATFCTIHNVAHAGAFHRSWLGLLGLPSWLDSPEHLEFHGAISMLKAGLTWSTMIGTVSPTYAREIQAPALGFRMDGLLRKRAGDFVGILNGLDTTLWDPSRAEDDPAGSWPTYSIGSLTGKDAHKVELRKRLALQDDPASPLFGFVSRLDPQKGIEALFEAIPRFLRAGCQLAILGDGADKYRETFRALAAHFRGRVGGMLAFDPLLAKRIYAASDFFLMPSKFEPCGLSQMIACRYGSLPIVASTGGLADTIRDADGFPDGNGFVFGTPQTLDDGAWLPAASAGLTNAVERALTAFGNRPRFAEIRRRAMSRDFSWDRSAIEYERVYAECIRREHNAR